MTEYRKSLIEKLFAIDEGFGAFRFDFDGDSLKLKHPLEEAMAVIERDAELMEEKDEKIKQLEAQVPRWIPVEERLPDEGEKVIVRDMGGETQMGTYTDHSKLGRYLWWWTRNTYLKVACWMPESMLPEAPKEEHE